MLVKLLILLSFFIDTIKPVDTLDFNAEKCIGLADGWIYNNNFTIYLKTDSSVVQKTFFTYIIDFDSYAGIINAVLTADGQIFVLDKYLNQISQINAFDLGLMNLTHISLWSSSRLWIYDYNSKNLNLIDFYSAKIEQRLDLSFLSDIKSFKFFDILYFYADEKIFAINKLFEIKRIFNAGEVSDFYVLKNKLTLLKNNLLEIYDLQILTKKQFILNEKFEKICFFDGQHIFLKKNQKIYHFIL